MILMMSNILLFPLKFNTQNLFIISWWHNNLGLDRKLVPTVLFVFSQVAMNQNKTDILQELLDVLYLS